MKAHLRYCVMGASIDCDETRHPQKVMLGLGITCQHATPVSMSDQWLFWNCENVPDELPKFINVLGLDPMELVGCGLSQDNAEKIRDYQKGDI